MKIYASTPLRPLARKAACPDSSESVSDEYLSYARRQGLSHPLTGLGDERLLDPDSLVKEGWTQDGDAGYSFPGPQGRPVQQYIRFADSEAPFTERLATYRWRGHHFEAQIITRARDGATCRFMQAG